jgi:lipocalin
MTDDEIDIVWRRFMRAKLEGIPLKARFTMAGIDVDRAQEAFIVAHRDRETFPELSVDPGLAIEAEDFVEKARERGFDIKLSISRNELY